MTRRAEPKAAWIAAAVHELRERGCWTGRIHVHKALVLAELSGLIQVPFEFQLYTYGPYSFEVDQCFSEMETFGVLQKTFPRAGYGPRYGVTQIGLRNASKLPQRDRAAIGRVASEIAKFDSRQLEVIATCAWVADRENRKDDDEIIKRVIALKPRYSEAEVRQRLRQARRLLENLE